MNLDSHCNQTIGLHKGKEGERGGGEGNRERRRTKVESIQKKMAAVAAGESPGHSEAIAIFNGVAMVLEDVMAWHTGRGKKVTREGL